MRVVSSLKYLFYIWLLGHQYLVSKEPYGKKLKIKVMKTSEKFLASKFFEKLIKSTFSVNVVRIRKTIPASSKFFSIYGDDEYLCYASNRLYEVHTYSIKDGFKKLDVVHTISEYSGEAYGIGASSSTKYAKYYELADALIADLPETVLFIAVKCNRWGSDGECEHVTIYNAPDLTKYLKK